MMNKITKFQSGAVSLFIVVFTSMLLAVVTIGFTKIMLSDQQQASVEDVSQSAYDSAMSGVEDAKRLVLLHQACESGEATNTASCAAARSALGDNRTVDNQSCDTLREAGIVGGASGDEVPIRQTSSGSAAERELDQAYTCVKVATQLKDYLGHLAKDTAAVIPLVVPDNFTSVKLSWFNIDDIPESRRNNINITYPTSPVTLHKSSSGWGVDNTDTPPMIRAQVIQTGESGNLSDFNTAAGANSAFFYPVNRGGNTNYSMVNSGREDKAIANTQPVSARCDSDNVRNSKYACSINILPNPVSVSGQRYVYLHLTSFYKSTNYKIEFNDGLGNAMEFGSPQIEIDSTGRANNLFRRIATRVETTGKLSYPTSAALSVKQSLCKDFIVGKTKYRNYAEGC